MTLKVSTATRTAICCSGYSLATAGLLVTYGTEVIVLSNTVGSAAPGFHEKLRTVIWNTVKHVGRSRIICAGLWHRPRHSKFDSKATCNNACGKTIRQVDRYFDNSHQTRKH